ncbi:LOW QUALITY PROTEIN: hypothetical protein KUTeg_005040 [Tegillarca granosa]|uniref:FLYWCH-type domain-containing protein n=1 Tax=Tegillarca granosa TaxID=220873 RepID=A0ABQ9FIM7_TEGGR|nr:LOW QUALITY PROTEIN: hypothetical protein KUTeg_005040 [Tegillarca granosa]
MKFTIENAQLDVIFTTNRLGNQSLIHNGYNFHIKTRRGDRIYWQCSTRDRRATINILNSIPTKIAGNHNHQPDSYTPNYETEPETNLHQYTSSMWKIKLRNREWNDDTQQLVQQIPTFLSCKGQF